MRDTIELQRIDPELADNKFSPKQELQMNKLVSAGWKIIKSPSGALLFYRFSEVAKNESNVSIVIEKQRLLDLVEETIHTFDDRACSGMEYARAAQIALGLFESEIDDKQV